MFRDRKPRPDGLVTNNITPIEPTGAKMVGVGNNSPGKNGPGKKYCDVFVCDGDAEN